jgi:phosphoglycerol transferase MdoB-like AlkP superfamily enzyme
MDVLRILFNILIFTTSLFAAALLVEKIYAGRWKWVAFAILIAFITGFALFPGTLIAVLEALPGGLTLANAAILILGGVAAGFLATGV